MSAHFHVAYGIAGYGPDADENTPTLESWEDVADYLHSELREVSDMVAEDANMLAESGAYEDAWNTLKRADDVDMLRANLDPRRAQAPLYRDDAAAWRDTIQRTIGEHFPLDTIGASRLYVWDCVEAECQDEDN